MERLEEAEEEEERLGSSSSPSSSAMAVEAARRLAMLDKSIQTFSFQEEITI